MERKLPGKAPGEITIYSVDFSQVLVGAELLETIVSTVTDAGITVTPALGTPATSVNFEISGGDELETYRFTILLETDTGSPKRRIERSFCITVGPQPC